MNNTDLKSRLNTYAHNAEKALGGYLKESTEDYKVLIEAMRYSLLGGGKRIRAALCQEFCRICGKERSQYGTAVCRRGHIGHKNKEPQRISQAHAGRKAKAV